MGGQRQLIIEEGWKPLSSPAAGAWLNEYARRARHYALWLTFITQFFRDFDSEQGRAMLSNHAIALCLPNERRDLEHARDSLALTDTDIAEITALPSQKGELLDAVHDHQARPRRVRIAPGDPEYWIASSNPEHRPATPARRPARDRRGPVEGAHPALRPRLARAATPAAGSRAMTVTVPAGRRTPDQADLAGPGRRVHDRARPGRAARRRRQPALHTRPRRRRPGSGRVRRVDRDRLRAAVGRDQGSTASPPPA